jgi:hypothetical protein
MKIACANGTNLCGKIDGQTANNGIACLNNSCIKMANQLINKKIFSPRPLHGSGVSGYKVSSHAAMVGGK